MFLACIKCGFKTDDWPNSLTCPHHSPYYSYLDVVGYAPSEKSFLKKTSLIPLPNWGKPEQKIFVKDESENPTGSIKDREVSAIFDVAITAGIKKVGVVSAGNGAKSAAYFAKKFGLDCICVVPKSIPAVKRDYLVNVLKVRLQYGEGDYETIFKQVVDEHFFYNVTPGINPFASEGTKQIAFELIEDLTPISAVIVPVGNGTQLAGIWKGFKEQKLQNPPRMIGVEVSGCDPVYQAVSRNTDYYELDDIPDTLATGIAARAAFTSPKAIAAIRESGGEIIRITEQELISAIKALENHPLLAPEPTSCSVFAALDHLSLNGNIVCILSGGKIQRKEHEFAKEIVE